MKIGKTDIPHGLILCPMAGVTDRAFRRITALHRAEYAVSEMVSAKALVYEQRSRESATMKTSPLCIVDEGLPTAVQLFGCEPDFIAEAARLISTGSYRGFCGELASAIDINMGCPVRKITANGEGSSLMRDPGLAEAVTAAAVEGSAVPVTVKIRAGWDDEHKNAVEIAKRIEKAGASALCVHARTREQMYAPGVDLSVIFQVKEAVSIPVIGNGDIFTSFDALKMLSFTKCDGLGIARGAIGNPWLFAEIAAAIDRVDYMPPDQQEIIKTAISHARLCVELKGERRGIAEAKPQIARYIHGISGAVRLRDEIIRSATLQEVEAVLERLL